MPEKPEQEQLNGHDEPPRIASGGKTLVVVTVSVVAALMVVAVAFYMCAPATVTGRFFSDDIRGKDRTDEEMIAYFEEHRAEFDALLTEYGLPDSGEGGGSYLQEEGQRLGGVDIYVASWHEYRYGLNQAEGVDEPRALWLASWDETGMFHSQTKGYVYTRDRLTPLVGELRAENPYAWTDGRNDAGVSFVDIGDGWYLFYAWRWD